MGLSPLGIECIQRSVLTEKRIRFAANKASTMILYKFKTLDPFVYIADLFLTRRLYYCPRPHELNDPLEGVLGMSITNPSSTSNFEQSLDHAVRSWSAVDSEINRYRLCCFSATPEPLLMWSHYGNGHSGICLELDLTSYEDKIIQVE